MTTRIQQTSQDLSLRFGLGINSVASDERVDDRECVSGRNVLLTHDNSSFVPRPPFDYLGTVPNGQPIRGFVTLRDSDGVVTMLVQAGGVVYEWDGGISTAAFTVVSNDTTLPVINVNSQLRGRQSHYWALDDLVIITDLAKLTPILTWNGTTLSRPTMLKGDGTAFGNFYAKYCVVRDERAIYANVRDATQLPHLLVGSMLSSYRHISSNIAPAGAASPFFILTPDLRPINGLAEAFGLLAISSEYGSMWKLTGADATDFAFLSLFTGSGAVGVEGVEYVGNDVVYGRQGRLESLIATDTFGDVATDDLTRHIADQVEDVASWQVIYNSRNQRIYCLADGGPDLWVYHKALTETGSDAQGGLGASKWMLWQTNHSLSFQPTAMMTCLHPVDGLEYVFMGDEDGNLYRLEGTYDSGGDGGTTEVVAERLSKLFVGPLDTVSFNLDGWIRARSAQAAELAVVLEYVGERGFSRDRRDLEIQDPFGSVSYYGGTVGLDAAYYGGSEEDGDAAYYSELGRGPFSRFKVGFAGSGHDFQIRTTVRGDTEATIGEIGLRYRVAK